MPTFRITGPDGASYQVTAPEGASQDDVLAYVRGQTQVPAQTPQPAAQPKPEDPGLMVRVGHGANNAVAGMQQLYYMATGQGDKLKALTDQTNADNALYQQGRAANGRTGMDVASMLGEAGMYAPAALAGAPASVAGRLALAAGTGAAQGAASFSEDPTLANKATQAAVGGVTGPLVQGAGEAIAPLASKVAGKVAQGVTAAKNVLSGATDANAAGSAMASAIGPEAWQALDAATQDQLTTQAQKVLSSGRQLDPEALLRQADIKAVGATGTTGQITRDPAQFYWEQEAAKMRGPNGDVGAPLVQRFQQDNAALMGQLPCMKPAQAVVGYDAAETAREAVQGFAKGTQADVGKMYQAARDSADANTLLPYDPVAKSLSDITENYGLENVKPAIVKRAQEYGLLGGDVRSRWLTIDEAERFRKFIGNNTDWRDPTSAAVGKSLQGSLDDAVGQVGSQAGDAFTAARQAAKARFQALEPRTVAALNDTSEAPVNFVEQMITGKKPGEIAALRDVVSKQDPNAWGNIKATTLDWLQRKATANDPEGKFSGKRLSDALDQIGMARLQQIFEPQELARLGTIRRASYALTREPPYSAVNHSNTGSTIANLVNNRMIGPTAAALAHVVPVVGPMALGAYTAGKDALQQVAAAKAAQAAANPSIASVAPTAVNSAALRQALARVLMRGAPIGVAGAEQFFQ